MCMKIGGGVLVFFWGCVELVRGRLVFFPALSHSQCMHMLNIYDGRSYTEKPSWKGEWLLIFSCIGLFLGFSIFNVFVCTTIRKFIMNSYWKFGQNTRKSETTLLSKYNLSMGQIYLYTTVILYPVTRNNKDILHTDKLFFYLYPSKETAMFHPQFTVIQWDCTMSRYLSVYDVVCCAVMWWPKKLVKGTNLYEVLFIRN